jgi:hypothetical protein
VAFLEYYDRKNRRTISGLTTVAAMGGGAVGTVLLYKAIFGSCPTVYSLGDDGPQLEAELFSHSISSRYETTDLDRLHISHDSENNISIDIVNEALETHYINNLYLLALDVPKGYEAFPTPDEDVLLVGKNEELLEASSRSGINIKDLIASSDQKYYQSGEVPLRNFIQQLDADWIDLVVNVPDGVNTIYLQATVRNTLMATVFLYDIAIGSQGFHAIDWMGSEIASPWYAWRFADWFQGNFGITVSVLDGDSYQLVDRIAPTGPIAWHQTATKVPIPKGDIARLRLSFIPDNWAIDQLAVSFDSTEVVKKTRIKPGSIAPVRGNKLPQAVGLLKKNDKDYFITYPGDRYRLQFSVNNVSANSQRTYFLVSSGYYIEWLRMSWIEKHGSYGPKVPLEFNDDLLKRTATGWLEKRESMESQFYSSRLPLGN